MGTRHQRHSGSIAGDCAVETDDAANQFRSDELASVGLHPVTKSEIHAHSAQPEKTSEVAETGQTWCTDEWLDWSLVTGPQERNPGTRPSRRRKGRTDSTPVAYSIRHCG